MMKKLIVLMLVLGLTTAANATLQLSLNGTPAPSEYTMSVCTTIKIDLTSSENNTAYGAWVGFDQLDKGEWVGTWTVYPIAGNTAKATDQAPDYPGWWILEATTSDPDKAPITAGKHFDIDYHCTAMGDVTLILQDFNGNELQRMVIHQIPEPVSMLLLGLGGLFLRRRK